MSNDSDNMATIAAQEMRIDELQTELKKTRDCAQDLIVEIAAERKLRDEFEEWMEAEDKQNRECYAIEPNGQSRGQLSQSIDTMIAWSELKAKHLSNESEAE